MTFNGRTFDVPLLRGRFSQNRRWLSAAAQDVPLLQNRAAHLDLLHPARRLWRRRLQSVRLINLEEQILGLGRAESDVPGSLIPYLYIQYLQTGNATEMGRIFYHNREDIVSMVPLAERLCRIFDDPFAPGHRAEIHGLDMLSLGHTYESAGKLAVEAEAAFRHADADLTAVGIWPGWRISLLAWAPCSNARNGGPRRWNSGSAGSAPSPVWTPRPMWSWPRSTSGGSRTWTRPPCGRAGRSTPCAVPPSASATPPPLPSWRTGFARIQGKMNG